MAEIASLSTTHASVDAVKLAAQPAAGGSEQWRREGKQSRIRSLLNSMRPIS